MLSAASVVVGIGFVVFLANFVDLSFVFVCCGVFACLFVFFFFFQAEDGIRDTSVTGVQTCALPILASRSRSSLLTARASLTSASLSESSVTTHSWSRSLPPIVRSGHFLRFARSRSEERRVGKECRTEWWGGH